MIPAMDRAPNPARRLVGLAVVLAVGSIDLGCARIQGMRREDPMVLGTQHVDSDIYANSHGPRTAPVAEGTPMTPPVAVGATEGTDDPLDRPVSFRPPESPASASVPGPTDPEDSSHLVPTSGVQTRPKTLPSDPAAVVARTRAAVDRMATYQVNLHRQERVNGTLLAEEDVVLAIRRTPRAVRLTWPSGPHQGREVLYRADEPGGRMHVNMADSALPVPRLSIDPDSPMVMKNSRHPITEAGFDSIVAALEAGLQTPGGPNLTDAGLETVSPLDHPHRCLIQSRPGETCRVYLDPATDLPALVLTQDNRGQLLERYLFRDVRPDLPELNTTGAFDPETRWGPPKGLFSRMARGSSPTATPTPH